MGSERASERRAGMRCSLRETVFSAVWRGSGEDLWLGAISELLEEMHSLF